MTEAERNLLLAVAHILRTPYSHLDQLIDMVEAEKPKQESSDPIIE